MFVVEDLHAPSVSGIPTEKSPVESDQTSSVEQYLAKEFWNQVTVCKYVKDWSLRLPDLTPLDFFQWGYLKQKVYVNPPQILQDLKGQITHACTKVRSSMLERA
ncbi:hypothetical protein TNCV_1619401 [Trichonephila clavipes]|nr:hypothetical protein TNCV_1619401 [Trichonephila clavipes]